MQHVVVSRHSKCCAWLSKGTAALLTEICFPVIFVCDLGRDLCCLPGSFQSVQRWQDRELRWLICAPVGTSAIYMSFHFFDIPLGICILKVHVFFLLLVTFFSSFGLPVIHENECDQLSCLPLNHLLQDQRVFVFVFMHLHRYMTV